MSHIGKLQRGSGDMRDTLDVLDKARAERAWTSCRTVTLITRSAREIGTAVFDEESFSKWDYSDLMITAGPYKNQRCTKELFEKLREEEPDMYVVASVMNEEEIDMAYTQPYVMVGSDCGLIETGWTSARRGNLPENFGTLCQRAQGDEPHGCVEEDDAASGTSA